MILNISAAYKEFQAQCLAQGYNPMCVPKVKSITLSVGCGKHSKDSARLDYIESELTKIAGQKCVRAAAKESISNFGLREGMINGMHVRLRKENMLHFLDRLILIALPRIQDFNGLSHKSFDQSHNYNFGIEKQDIFVESNGNHLFGMNVCIEIHAPKGRQDALKLLLALNMPFPGVELKEEVAHVA